MAFLDILMPLLNFGLVLRLRQITKGLSSSHYQFKQLESAVFPHLGQT